jgi:PAS domain S-box-containing protein
MPAYAAEATLNAILESASQAILVCDPHGSLVLANAMAERLFGYTRGELLNTKIEVLVPARLRSLHVEHRRGFFEDPRVRPMGVGLELAAVRKDGTEFPVEISLSYFENPDGTFAVSFITDITERKRKEDEIRSANEALLRSNAALEQFASAASHDLREPLRMVESYAQLLARRSGDRLGPDAREYIDYITAGVRRLDSLLSAMLNYSRAQQDSGLPRVASGQSALDQALANLSNAVAQSGAVIVAGALPDVAAAETHLVLLFQNLISNAIKYRSEQRPEIEITAPRDGAWVTFSVKDNGIGIAPEHHQRVFGLFKRLHGAKYEGDGVGLAICKRIVESYGGRIWIESQPGSGSRFYFTLPALAERALHKS